MDLNKIPISWFDFAVVIVLLLGLSKGRKNGMSVELMIMLQWLSIIFAAAFLYKPLGDELCLSSPVSHLFAYIAMYIAVAIVMKIAFSLLKKMMGGKMVGSNVFGRAEYYLGMIAGAVRFTCILIAALALLNAPYYSPQELAKARAYQVDLYGSAFFPGLGATQQQVFKDSMLGSALKHYAGFMLITTTKAEKRDLARPKDELP
jgi:uncharacterized membrane protein required for colicin V production